MNEDSETKSRSTGLFVTLLLVPIFYVLSVGPAALVASKSGGSFRWFRTVYAPVEWIYQSQPKTQKPLEAYLRLWGVK